MATKPPSPAQLAARERFAEMARSGSLNRKRQIAAKKRKANPGLYDNINAKRERIAAGSGERMRRPGTKGAPTEEAFKRSAKTAKPRKRNPASGLVKGYAVVCMHPNPHTVAITTSMVDAKKIGQDYATRENVQVAIKPVSVHKAHFA